ncbi:MAG: Fic family protein [Gemmatimonadetes bacterium]|nr:Fic family protein [Gemmatimonadota bacterium]
MTNDASTDMTPRQEAHTWWEERASSGRYVGSREELPSTAAVRVLRDERLIAETPRGWAWVILGRENPDADQALPQNRWPLVRVALDEYWPAEIFRISAVRLLVGDTTVPATLHVRHAASGSRHRLEVTEGFEVVLVPDDIPSTESEGLATGSTVRVTVGGVELPVTSPERTLVSLTVSDVREHRDLVLAWLRSLVVAQPALDAAYRANSRHVLMARMGHLARDLGNNRLADQIQSVLSAHQRHRVSRTITGVGGDIVVPNYMTARPSTRDPGLDRLQARLCRAAEVMGELVGDNEETISPMSEMAVIRVARSAKLEDTYHSTTIEGYRISREEVRAVLEDVPYEGRTPDEITRLMALKGYSQAFDRTLALIGEAFGHGGPQLGEAMIFDLYIELWGPSIDAGIVSATDMGNWRESPVFIRQSRHVPPGPEKVGRYMAQFVEQINGLDAGPITRAVLTHWGFVHIHPFMDGNGRLARLLMNYMLGGSGLPWTTIRVEQRLTYFRALDRAHVEDEFAPLLEFFRNAIVRSAQVHS